MTKQFLCTAILNVVIILLFLAYGRCDHQLSCDILQKEFQNYEITWSNEGY
jgi:hypothetical protein